METGYTKIEKDPPPSYTVRVGDLGRVNLCEEDQPELSPAKGGVSQDEEDRDDLSSVDDAFDVLSITSSIDDRLT